VVERTAGPFEYYQEIHGGVNGDTIRADAQDPGLQASTIQALAGELEGDAQQVAGQLSGDITADVQANPKTASATAKSLAAKGHYAVGLIGSFAGMVDTFDSTVNNLNHEYKSELASSMRYAGEAAAATKTKADDAKVTEANMGPAIKGDLQPEYKAAVAKLDDDADSIATKFKQGPTAANVRGLIRAGLIPLSAAAFYPGLELTTADKTSYWRNTLGQMTSQQQIDWINAHKDELAPEAAPFVQPDVQEHFADEVAADIKSPDDIDDDTVRLLTFFSSQQPFAHQLYSEVSPDDLGDAVRSLSSDAFPVSDDRPMHDRVADAQLYKGFLDAAGVTFATYTKGTGAYAPPSDLADTYFKAITDEKNPENASALTLLIRHGGEQTSFNDDFIRDVTGKTYEWELSHHGDPVWGPLNDPQYGIKDPTVQTGDPNDPYDDMVTGRNAADGLANLLGGMEHSPQAAKDFFMGHYDGSTQNLDQRMDYLVGGGDNRTWDVADNSDDGDGLGRALEAATVGEDHRTADGTAIASKLFSNIAEYGGKADGTFTHEWHIGPQMTDSLGAIASGYTGDIYDQLATGNIVDGPTHLNLGDDSDETLKRVLGELGRTDDKTGLETLTSAMLLEGKAHYGDQLDALQGARTLDNLDGAGLEGVQQTNGKVMGTLLHEGLQLASDDDNSDAKREEIMSRAVDAVAGFVPGAGEGASELTKMTVDTLKDQAIDQLKDSISSQPDTDAYLDNNVMSLDQKIQTNAVDSLVEHGFLGPQDTKVGPFDGIPPDVLVGPPGHQHINPLVYNHPDPDDMTAAQKAELDRVQDAWTRYNETPQSKQALAVTGQSEFMKYFEDPTLQPDN
jgi:hypothetical protein